MSHTFPISGTVQASSTTQPAPASSITYTIRYNDEQGRSNTVEGVVPAFNRWPEELVDTMPAPPRTRVHGYGVVVGNKTELFVHVPENPKIAPCPSQNARGGGNDERRKRFLPGTNPFGEPGDEGGGGGLPGVPPPSVGGGFGDQSGGANR